MKPAVRYSLRPERVATYLAAAAALLVVAHLVAMQANFNPALGVKERLGFEYWHVAIFDLDEEESFGTWFSSGILALASVLLIHHARWLRDRDERWYRWWLVLGLGFCVLSLDEVVGIHEYVNTLTEDTAWTVFGAAVFALVGAAYLPFLWRYRWRTGGLFLVAGMVYGGGAVGVEHLTTAPVNSLSYNMWTALEEGLEMAGVILLIYATLDHMRATVGKELDVHLELGGPTAP